MRACEFIAESASVGATASGSVATVVKPQITNDKGQAFFGVDGSDYPYGNVEVIVHRRVGPNAEKNKKAGTAKK